MEVVQHDDTGDKRRQEGQYKIGLCPVSLEYNLKLVVGNELEWHHERDGSCAWIISTASSEALSLVHVFYGSGTS